MADQPKQTRNSTILVVIIIVAAMLLLGVIAWGSISQQASALVKSADLTASHCAVSNNCTTPTP